MEKIKIIFLGTGNAIPTEIRNHTAILLVYKNDNILVDCGEGAQRQFRIAKLSPNKLTRLLLTHWHGDHILGIPGLFQTMAMQDYSKTLEVYGPEKTSHYFALLNKILNLKINCTINEKNGIVYENEEFFIQAEKMLHTAPTFAYSFVIKDKRRLDKNKIAKLKLPNSPLLKKLQEGKDIIFNNKKIKASQVSYLEKGRKITFILDTAPNANAICLAKNSDVLICEASFSNKETKLAKEYFHLTAKQSATIAKKAKVKKLILTHISQRYEHSPEIILNEAKKVFKNVFLVNDFDVIEI